ncbi:MAG TPA: glycosyltransferase, partial [Roseimicrobium sp.]|nr:glycosyltransferase [Roseimicrobium sp.]
RLLVWFGTLSGAKQFDWMISAWQAVKASGIPVALVALGASPALPSGIGSAGFVPLGHQPPDEVSCVLQIADVVGLPFVDGVSERRGSFTAALSHGCPVVGTLGSNTGPSLRASDDFVGVESAFGREAFVAAVKQLFQSPTRCVRLRHRAKMIYASRYDWPVLMRRLEDALFKS